MLQRGEASTGTQKISMLVPLTSCVPKIENWKLPYPPAKRAEKRSAEGAGAQCRGLGFRVRVSVRASHGQNTSCVGIFAYLLKNSSFCPADFSSLPNKPPGQRAGHQWHSRTCKLSRHASLELPQSPVRPSSDFSRSAAAAVQQQKKTSIATRAEIRVYSCTRMVLYRGKSSCSNGRPKVLSMAQ